MGSLPTPAGIDRPLPVRRAFVLQLRADAEVGRGVLVGRIEHVASGRVAHFESLAELLRFIADAAGSTRTPED